MRNLFFFIILSFSTNMLTAQVLKTITISAGNLSTSLTSDELKTVTNLKINGTIDASDFQTMRDDMISLGIIDLSDVTIEGNVLPAMAFYNSATNKGKVELLRIKLPQTLTYIGKQAFKKCINIDSIDIPDNVTAISEESFMYCSNLKVVRFSKSLEKIGKYSFCTSSIGKVFLVETNTRKIEESAFQSCSNINEFEMNEGIDTIENNSFMNCIKIPNLIFPSTIKVIGSSSFSGCTGVTKIKFNTKATSSTIIYNQAFADCSGISDTLIIPSSITKIVGAGGGSTGAFFRCSKIPYVKFEEGINSIGALAFMMCAGIKGVLNIPATVETIGSDAFSDCSGITKVNLSNGLVNIYDKAFMSCTSLKGSLKLPETLKTIGYAAFWGCNNLTSVEIPSSVTTIGEVGLNSIGFSSIKVSNPSPINIISTSFRDVDKTACFLYVPTGSKVAYSYATGWKDFKNIIEFDIPNTPKVYNVNINYIANGKVYIGSDLIANGANLVIEENKVITFIIAPSYNYIVQSILLNNTDVTSQLVGSNGSYTFTTPAITTISTIIVTFKEKPLMLSIKSGESGSVGLEVERNSTRKISFLPSTGWNIYSMKFNSTDLTHQIINNTFTTPIISLNSTLEIVFKQADITTTPSIKNSNVQLKTIVDNLIVSGVGNGKTIEVFDINGRSQQIAIANGYETIFKLKANQIYIVKADNEIYKISL